MTETVLRNETPSVHERFTDIQQLYDACEQGDVAKATALLQKYPEALNGGDYDMTFFYPAHFGRSLLYQAAIHGHLSLVKVILDMGANPIPHEVAGQYHADDFTDWTSGLRERGHDAVVDVLNAAREAHYGPLVDDAQVHAVVRTGNVERVKQLIDENSERLKQVDAIGNTPLHWAVIAGDMEMVRLLVERECPIDAQRGDGRTPSLVAIFGFHRYWRREEKPEILDYLLEHGAAHTMLIAAAVGNIDRVRQLTREAPDSANAIDPCHRRPISAASEIGNVEIVKLLLEHGADPNARELMCQGGYALHTAAANNHIETARLLLEAGTNAEHWVDSSGTPIIIAAYRNHEEMMQLLYSYGATTEIQFYAAKYRIDVIAEVLKLKPSLAGQVLPYQWDKPWDKPKLAMDIMQLAIRYGATFEDEAYKLINTTLAYRNVAQLLFEHGGNPSQPLAYAARGFHGATRDTVAFLVEACGADVNSQENEQDLTPLASAASSGQKEIVEYLLSKGAKVNLPDTPSWATPLHLAQKNGHSEIVEILQKHSTTT